MCSGRCKLDSVDPRRARVLNGDLDQGTVGYRLREGDVLEVSAIIIGSMYMDQGIDCRMARLSASPLSTLPHLSCAVVVGEVYLTEWKQQHDGGVRDAQRCTVLYCTVRGAHF